MDENFKDVTACRLHKMTVEMNDAQFERLIAPLRGGGGGGVATVVGPMGPCGLGKDKLKRPKRWSDWRKDAENKMRFLRIEENSQRLNFVTSCAGAELTEFWEKEVRVRFEVHPREAQGRAEVPGGGEGVQHLQGQRQFWHVKAVQEEEGSKKGEGGLRGDH